MKSRYQVTASSHNPGLGNHMADDGTEAFEQAKALALNEQRKRTLNEIERALARMDADTYGYCERCGEAIDFARLKALPYATLCIRCQTFVEH
ncbi:MAG: TraR/DksA C4-type zinc finger protein [Anaerolineae bacterium]|nr:MAG: TraR/DksA C4-type zinc finger protein [Anaerolineae bacterium]